MSDKQTQEVKIIHPRKKSWFGCWGSPDMSTVVIPKGRILAVDDTNQSPKPHAIGRSVPKSADDNSSFGF
jgi:hypothetical protein